MNEEIQEEDRELEEPQEPMDPSQEKNPHERKPTWLCEISKVKKDMELQKKHIEEGRELGPSLVM